MWSASRVAELKASLQQPGVKFTKLQAEPKAKVYTAGQSIGLEHDDPLTIQTTLNNLNDNNNNNNNNTTNDDDKDNVITLEQKNALSNALSSSTSTTTTKTNTCFMNNTTKIVLDSGAFISGTNLTSYGPDCEYYTLQEVIDELRDEQAKFNFHTFPYPITVKEPSSLSMAYITNISKQTGDFYVLSFVDRKVLALCHQLEVETNGDKYIHYQVQRVELNNNNNKNNMSTTDIEAKAKKDMKNVTQQQQQKQKQNNQKTSSTTTESTATPEQTTTTTTTTITPTDPRAWVNEFVANDFDIALLLSDVSDDYNNDINQIGQDSPQQQQQQQKEEQEQEQEEKKQQKTIEGYTIFPSTFETFIPTLGNSSTQQLRVQRQHAGKFILPGFDDGNWVTQSNMQTLQEKSSRSSTISLSATTKASALGANHLLPAATITATDINISSKTNNNNNNNNKMTMTVKDSQKQVQQQNDEKKKQQQQQNNNNNNNQKQQRTLVGGITTDYSMQNVMLQAGLQCLTIDGRAITTIRQYIMGCHACFTLSKDMSRGFCPTCGGFTMVRIIVNVDARGRPHYQWPINRINNTRGTIFQISKKAQFGVKGKGKIILREDMLPKPKLKEVLIARGERAAPTEETTFNDAALFATMRNFDAKNVTYGYGNRNMNISRKRRR